MEEDGLEGSFPSELQPHHDHARHPEEQDVVPRLHNSGGVVPGEVGAGILGPAGGGKGPQAAGEPRVQHIFVLPQDYALPKSALVGSH